MFVVCINKNGLSYGGKKRRVGMKVIFERDVKEFEKAEMPKVNIFL